MICKEKKKILYLGLHLPPLPHPAHHFPIIRVQMRPLAELEPHFRQGAQATHFLLTSPTALTLTFEVMKQLGTSPNEKKFILIGKGTQRALQKEGAFDCTVAKRESAEGILELLETLCLTSAHLFYPHSSLARSLISEALFAKKIKTTECILYDTVANLKLPPPPLASFDEIFFTSPSTVDAFLQIYGHLPKNKKLKSIGPLTKKYLDKKRN